MSSLQENSHGLDYFERTLLLSNNCPVIDTESIVLPKS